MQLTGRADTVAQDFAACATAVCAKLIVARLMDHLEIQKVVYPIHTIDREVPGSGTRCLELHRPAFRLLTSSDASQSTQKKGYAPFFALGAHAMNDRSSKSALDVERTPAELVRTLRAAELELREAQTSCAPARRRRSRVRSACAISSTDSAPPSSSGLMTPQGILIEANRPALAALVCSRKMSWASPSKRPTGGPIPRDVQQQLREAIARAARGEASRYDVQVRAGGAPVSSTSTSPCSRCGTRPARSYSLVPSASVITERKQTENALRESNEKFQLLADNITDAFWIRSPDMREVHYVSPAFERIWGRSADKPARQSAPVGRLHPARGP